MVDVSELKKLKNKGLVHVLPYGRVSGGALSNAVLSVVASEALSVPQITDKLREQGFVHHKNAIYTTCRRLEKKGKLVAIQTPSGLVYFDKKRAEAEGLIRF